LVGGLRKHLAPMPPPLLPLVLLLGWLGRGKRLLRLHISMSACCSSLPAAPLTRVLLLLLASMLMFRQRRRHACSSFLVQHQILIRWLASFSKSFRGINCAGNRA
jgi:hypothetical protein